MWRNLGEQPVYENRWFRILLADVELPDGRHLEHFLMRLPPVALWADGAEHVGHPVDDFESSRREWIPLTRVPRLVAEGAVHAANTAAALLLLAGAR